jgi:coenzyme F420 biosynthesis associated uncharacterized protein
VSGTVRRRRRPDRDWGLGFVAGAMAGLGAAYVERRARRALDGGLVDWPRAQRIAAERLRRAPGALLPGEIRRVEPEYAEAMRRVVPALEAALGTRLPGVVERHVVVDRAGWASANLDVFRSIYGRIEAMLGDRVRPPDGNLAGLVGALGNRFVATQQVGLLLGFLGARVLGQYDIALLSAEARPGQLLFVEENIRWSAAQLGVPVSHFRTWIALHETTHAFEFEAHPWLRPYLADRLERQLAGLVEDARLIGVEGLGGLLRRLRPRTAARRMAARRWNGGRSGLGMPPGPGPGPSGLVEGLLAPEQRRLFRETQAIMSLLEGFSDWVMDRVGATIIPDVAVLRSRLEERRGAPKKPLDRLLARITGMDLKLEQYRRGERFVAGVAVIGGPVALEKIWSGPEALPTDAELGDPAAWCRRVVPARAATL